MRLVRALRVNGARGIALLGFAGLALLHGVAFGGGPLLGDFAIWPPPPYGLRVLDAVGGLHAWGVVWMLAGLWLLVGAFKQDQRRPLAAFSALTAVWGGAYLYSFLRMLADGQPSGLWLSSGLYLTLLVACIGTARMLNAPPLHIDAITTQLREVTENEIRRHRTNGGGLSAGAAE